jgi:MinD-like ATPase involved in chromosome partitioning or flagellar assembly
MPSDEIIIETQRIGAILRVAAVDVATGTEVVFQAPASATRESIQRLAASKLRYVMTKATGAKA